MALFSSTIAQLEEYPQWALLPGKIKVKQHYKYDCGAACLASVATFYGIYCSLAHLRMLCGCTPDGISVQGIIDGAAQIGLCARGMVSKNKDMEGLGKMQFPAIAHITDDGDYLHYIVIYGISGRFLKIMDPAQGKLEKMPADEFRKKWTGYIIAITPDAGLQHNKGKKGDKWIQLKPLVAGNMRELLLTFAATVLCTAAAISTTLLLQQIVDHIVPQGNVPLLIAVSFAAVSLMSVSLYGGYMATKYLIKCSIKTECLLMASYIRKLFRLPLGFFDNYTAGDISSRTDDIHFIRSFITGGIIGIATSLITLIGAIGIMFLYDSRLATIIAMFVPLYWLLYRISDKLNTRYGKKVANANAKFESTLLGSIHSTPTLRHCNMEEPATDKVISSQIMLAEELQHSAKAANILETLLEGVSKVLICIILSAGTFAVLDGKMTVGELVGFYSLCSFFTIPVNDLISAGSTMAKAKVAYERIFEILSLTDADADKGNISPQELDGDITISGLHFRYPGREPLFNGFSATIKKGETTRIEGENGSGKSTLLKLLMGDFTSYNGKICYAGTEIRQFKGKTWRSMIAFVAQRPVLLEGNILENITLYEVDPDIKRVMEICSTLKMDKMLERFPQGLLTKVGNGGKGVSGGESQKICIARALYKDARIYIFDEATSSLNSEGEETVAECINSLREKGRTVMYISHKNEYGILTNNVVKIN